MRAFDLYVSLNDLFFQQCPPNLWSVSNARCFTVLMLSTSRRLRVYNVCLISYILTCIYICNTWHFRHCNVDRHQVKFVAISSFFFILFTSMRLSKSQCWPTSIQHRINIVCLISCLYRRHRNVNRRQFNVVSTSYILYPV